MCASQVLQQQNQELWCCGVGSHCVPFAAHGSAPSNFNIVCFGSVVVPCNNCYIHACPESQLKHVVMCCDIQHA
jgi:hypothetical protein